MSIMGFFKKKGNDKENDTKEQATKEQSLYSAIRTAIQPDGSLPSDFCVRRKAEKNKISFADGAIDGIAIYHMGHGEPDIQPLCEIVMLIAAAKFPEAEEKLIEYFSASEYGTMLPLIDGLQEWIIRNRDDIDPNNVYQFVLKTLKDTPHIECLKFALSVLELLDDGSNDETREIVETLVASDEFTLYCLFIMRHWPDANDVIFKTAKKVRGWGRVHAVEQLSPET